MSEAIITVENLSKSYLVGHQADRQARSRYMALRDVIGREFRNLARKTIDVVRGRQVLQGDEVEEFWALRNVSFEVKQGEVVGIIGRNGAGKSTLLKIVSRITEPTEGRAVLRGRVASLLEVGTGFHPELTGRENIFLNGAILGMTRREIQKKFDEIVAFAEVERFLDTPVKRFSSGMYVRLAFAVAAHLEPEILVVDEVLAVGDAEFQKKCLGKMDEVSRREGRTVLFVTHNMGMIKSLTQKCILLEKGRIATEGATNTVIDVYTKKALDLAAVSSRSYDLEQFRRPQDPDANAKIVRIGISLQANGGGYLPRVPLGKKFTIEVHVQVYKSMKSADLAVVIKTAQGVPVTSVMSSDCNSGLCLERGDRLIKISLNDLTLAPGNYLIDMALDPLVGSSERSCDVVYDYPLLSVIDDEHQIGYWMNRPWGSVYCQEVEWNTFSLN